jgi:hypothetical protein
VTDVEVLEVGDVPDPPVALADVLGLLDALPDGPVETFEVGELPDPPVALAELFRPLDALPDGPVEEVPSPLPHAARSISAVTARAGRFTAVGRYASSSSSSSGHVVP